MVRETRKQGGRQARTRQGLLRDAAARRGPNVVQTRSEREENPRPIPLRLGRVSFRRNEPSRDGVRGAENRSTASRPPILHSLLAVARRDRFRLSRVWFGEQRRAAEAPRT